MRFCVSATVETAPRTARWRLATWRSKASDAFASSADTLTMPRERVENVCGWPRSTKLPSTSFASETVYVPPETIIPRSGGSHGLSSFGGSSVVGETAG
jgi:hypothetical protein